MHDTPSAAQLLAAARMHLEQRVLPALTEPRLRFETLVAANVLSVVERELALGEAQAAAEWQRLNALEGVDLPFPAEAAARQQGLRQRAEALCRRIEQGEFDDEPARAALLRHLRHTVEDKLRVANPRFLSRSQKRPAGPARDKEA
jgi:hypothetical protein